MCSYLLNLLRPAQQPSLSQGKAFSHLPGEVSLELCGFALICCVRVKETQGQWKISVYICMCVCLCV